MSETPTQPAARKTAKRTQEVTNFTHLRTTDGRWELYDTRRSAVVIQTFTNWNDAETAWYAKRVA